MQSCIVDAILHRSSANMNLKVNAERFVVASKKHAIVSIRFTAHSLLTAHPPQNTIVIPALPESSGDADKAAQTGLVTHVQKEVAESSLPRYSDHAFFNDTEHIALPTSRWQLFSVPAGQCFSRIPL